mmetsp:Transcript_61206/g.122663  ORF Transcript_61206/g.122663 Transcript_61206/m.122663 type:complete len:88 (-) Transcript_61206:51-314(-)
MEHTRQHVGWALAVTVPSSIGAGVPVAQACEARRRTRRSSGRAEGLRGLKHCAASSWNHPASRERILEGLWRWPHFWTALVLVTVSE